MVAVVADVDAVVALVVVPSCAVLLFCWTSCFCYCFLLLLLVLMLLHPVRCSHPVGKVVFVVVVVLVFV